MYLKLTSLIRTIDIREEKDGLIEVTNSGRGDGLCVQLIKIGSLLSGYWL